MVSEIQRNDHPLAVIGYSGAAQGARMDGGSTRGYSLKMAPYTSFIETHMTGMSFSRTTNPDEWPRVSLCNEDKVFAARLLWSEINGFTVTKHNVTEAVKATLSTEVLDTMLPTTTVRQQAGSQSTEVALNCRDSQTVPISGGVTATSSHQIG